jgi:hypothetical protein
MTTHYTKNVNWSYPSSQNAQSFGHYLTGCYCVNVSEGARGGVAQAAFTSKQKAFAYADKEFPDIPWSRWTLSPDSPAAL